jgi:hypothetical protein
MTITSYYKSVIAKLEGKDFARAGTVACSLEDGLKVYREANTPFSVWSKEDHIVVYHGSRAYDEIYGTPEELAAIYAALT